MPQTERKPWESYLSLHEIDRQLLGAHHIHASRTISRIWEECGYLAMSVDTYHPARQCCRLFKQKPIAPGDGWVFCQSRPLALASMAAALFYSAPSSRLSADLARRDRWQRRVDMSTQNQKSLERRNRGHMCPRMRSASFLEAMQLEVLLLLTIPIIRLLSADDARP